MGPGSWGDGGKKSLLLPKMCLVESLPYSDSKKGLCGQINW